MTWNRNTVESKIVEIFTQHRQSDVEVEMTAKIVSDLGIDSLGVMEVLSEIEDEYKLVVPDDVLKSLETVGDVIKAITERLAADGKLSD